MLPDIPLSEEELTHLQRAGLSVDQLEDVWADKIVAEQRFAAHFTGHYILALRSVPLALA